MTVPTETGARTARAGFGRVEITPPVGGEMVGYRGATRTSQGVHDPLFASALVVESGARRIAICSVDLCYVGEDVVAGARRWIERETAVPGEAVLVAATHSHGGPHDLDPGWPGGLERRICAAAVVACERLQPATIGAGWGMVHGLSMNRRRFEDPVDPALLVIRVDALDGSPIGLYYGFGCHPVVLGPDNRLLTGDWPAICSAAVERKLGDGATAIFAQGSGADVNPLTPGVRERLARSRPVLATVDANRYYGGPDGARKVDRIGDRRGGTFAEAELIGSEVAKEVLRVHRGIVGQPVERVWSRSVQVDLPASEACSPQDEELDLGWAAPRPPEQRQLEVMLVGLDGSGVLLASQPGEVFAETGIALRRDLRSRGFRAPFVVGCANGWRGYLPPGPAHEEGGYEVRWARRNRLSRSVQEAVRARVLAEAPDRASRPASALPAASAVDGPR